MIRPVPGTSCRRTPDDSEVPPWPFRTAMGTPPSCCKEGPLGAYEYGAFKTLYEKRPGFTPVAVTGISIGAVTAAVVGGRRG